MPLPIPWFKCFRHPSPCRDCTDRHATCHIGCDRYRRWYDDIQAQKKPERKDKDFLRYYADRKKRFDKMYKDK